MEAAVAASVLDERQVVSEGRPGAGLAFRHPLVRLTCYEGLSAVQRRLLHSAYAEAVLRRRPAAVDTLATHLTRADDPRHRLSAAGGRAGGGALRQRRRRPPTPNSPAGSKRWPPTPRAPGSTAAPCCAASAGTRRRQGCSVRRWRSWAGAGDAEGRVLAARPAELTPKTRGTEDGLRLLDAFPPGPDTPAAVASAHHLARGVLYFVADRYEEGSPPRGPRRRRRSR